MLVKIIWLVAIAFAGVIVNDLIKKRTPDHEYITGYIVGSIALGGLQIIGEVLK
jgi:hypothetical protein